MGAPTTCRRSWEWDEVAYLLDNDVALKTCRYGLTSELLDMLEIAGPPLVLGSALFVLRGRLTRLAALPERAASECANLLDRTTALEPSEAELLLAADLLEVAQTRGLPLDGGEGQLIAILLERRGTLMLTGDKRAISAAETVLAMSGILANAAGRMACFEQAICSLSDWLSLTVVRNAVCSDAAADSALANCHCCHGDYPPPSDVREGLASYSEHLRAAAPILLARGNDLTCWLTSGTPRTEAAGAPPD